MQSSLEDGVVIARLDDGDDLFARIDELGSKHEIESGMVMWGIGMLRDFELGYFNGTAYEKKTFSDAAELLALHGSYAAKADPRLHIHMAAASRDHRVVGGHLFRARVSVVNELCLQRFDKTRLSRAPHPRLPLKVLTIE